MSEHSASSSGLIELVVEMERAVGQRRWLDAAHFFTRDCIYKVADRPEFRGIAGIEHYMNWQNSVVQWLGHVPRMAIQHGSTVIIEVESNFKRLSDQADIKVPCTDIYRFEDTRIYDWRVYADISLFLGDTFEVGAPVGKGSSEQDKTP